jgi:peptide deformylase
MAIVPIVRTKDNNHEIPGVLITPTEDVKVIDDKVRQVVKDLMDTTLNAKNPEAAGLAAPQIGSNKRICVVRKFTRVGQEHVIKNFVLINPKVLSKSETTDIKWEACLSVPDIYGRVKRSKRIKIKALDENGKELKLKAEGYFARVIQHEMDHLDGILFIKKSIGQIMTEKEFDAHIESGNEDL